MKLNEKGGEGKGVTPKRSLAPKTFLLLDSVLLIPYELATTFNTCCSKPFLERLKARFPDRAGSGQRSSWVEKVLTTELDRLDREGITNAQRDRWVREYVIPALKSLLTKKSFGEVYLYLNDEVKRNELIRRLGKNDVPVTDTDLVLALHGVLSEYES